MEFLTIANCIKFLQIELSVLLEIRELTEDISLRASVLREPLETKGANSSFTTIAKRVV